MKLLQATLRLWCASQELADDVPNSEKLCPETTANLASTITFSWIGGLMQQGYK